MLLSSSLVREDTNTTVAAFRIFGIVSIGFIHPQKYQRAAKRGLRASHICAVAADIFLMDVQLKFVQ